MADHPYLNHPEAYKLDPEGHRYHHILNVGIPSGGLADQLHARLGKEFQDVRKYHIPRLDALNDPKIDDKAVSRLIQYNDDMAGRVRHTRATLGTVDTAAYLQAHERLQNFLPVLAQHAINGHGDSPEGNMIRTALAGLRFEHGGMLTEGAEFRRLEDAGPADKKHVMSFGGMGMYGHLMRTKADNPLSDFYGAPHLLSPELLAAHELGHLMDFALGNARADGITRHHDPELNRRGHKPGLRMVSGFEWQHIHDQLGQAGRELGSPALGLPTLPQPFTRLHYPTHGNSAPHELPQTATVAGGGFGKTLALARQQVVAEWPTVTTELALADPSALAALDRVFGHDPRGRGAAEIVRDFWGTDFAPKPDPDRTKLMAHVLSETLKAGGDERGFQPMKEAGYRLSPNPLFGDKTVRGYAGGDL